MAALFQAMRNGAAAVFAAIGAAPTPTISSVFVMPTTILVSGSASQTFTASVVGTNSPPTDVTWTASAGSISSIGIFTAPPSTVGVQTITIRATSTFDTSKFGVSTVTVPAIVQPTVTSVNVSPSTVVMVGAGQQQFASQVIGANSPSQGVIWSASVGMISTSGLYTAPAATLSLVTATITATSTLDPTKSGSATAVIAALDIIPTVQQAYLLSVAGNGWLSGDLYDLRGRRARIDKVAGERQVYGLDLAAWLAQRGTTIADGGATLRSKGVLIDSRAYIVGGVIMCWIKGGDPDNLENQEPPLNYLTIHYKCANGTENEYTIWFDVLPL